MNLAADLVALGFAGLAGYTVHDLDKLTPAELLAVAFDVGEADPAQSLMLSIADDLAVISGVALGEVSEDIRERVLLRLGHRALVAAELHRRQRGALQAAAADTAEGSP